jgi:energy-coupling factor transporter ATP-binding protein EcfA2
VQQRSQTRLFLEELMRDLDGQAVGVWHLPQKTGRWFTDHDKALTYVQTLPEQADVYAHVGIAPANFPKPRAEAADLIGRLGCVADFDFPDEDAARRIIERAGLEPTLLVNSGHGVHGWWLFKKPYIFRDEEDRAGDNELAKAWHRTLLTHARDLGIEGKLDSVYDLARILRVPGTTNNKHLKSNDYNEPAPVTLIASDGPRYTAHDIAAALVEIQPNEAAAPPVKRSANLSDEDLLERMFAAKNGAKVRALWEGDTSSYGSHSEADLALCCHLAFWTQKDAAVIDRLFRQSGLYRDKWEREDYRAHTIGAAVERTGGTYSPTSKQTRGTKHVADAEAGDAALDELTQADAILFLAEDRSEELFAEEADDTPFAQVQTTSGVATWEIRSPSFRGWLLRQYRRELGKTPNTSATEQCLRQLEAEALGKDRRRLHLRAAWNGDALLIDRGDRSWSAFSVTPEGWRIAPRPPALFRRHPHMEAYPEPGAGGDLRDLFRFLPVHDKRDQILLLTWCATALVPDMPRPVLLLTGSQGSGKSTAARLLRRLLDPSSLELIRRPRDESDLLQALAHNYMIPFDNLTSLPTWCSDILCAAVTGVGAVKRKLYSDHEDVIFKLKRLIVLNGILNVAERPDLLDRSLHIQLGRIDRPLPERELIATFDEHRPALIGALLDILSKMIPIRRSLKAEGNFRMADFTLWGRAAAEALGYGEAAFMEAYQASVDARHEEAVEASPFATAVLAFMTECECEEWEGTASNLLHACEEAAAFARVDTSAKEWPGNARWASKRLEEVEVDLEGIGIQVTRKTVNGEKIIRLIRVPKDPSS